MGSTLDWELWIFDPWERRRRRRWVWVSGFGQNSSSSIIWCVVRFKWDSSLGGGKYGENVSFSTIRYICRDNLSYKFHIKLVGGWVQCCCNIHSMTQRANYSSETLNSVVGLGFTGSARVNLFPSDIMLFMLWSRWRWIAWRKSYVLEKWSIDS